MNNVLEKHEDETTLSYFDKNTPNYTANRYMEIINFINKEKRNDASLIDVGCGDGTVLKAFKDGTYLRNFTGMDISKNYLNLSYEQTGCNTILGSILDSSVVDKIDKKFDFVIVGAILHHLIGDNREKSKKLAEEALKNAYSLV